MASVASPKPSYRPHLPANVVSDGILSDAQLETIIYAGEAHSEFLAGSWTVDATFDVVAAARDDATDAVRFRRGWFLGDGTGAGKGRQVAGILLDNWLKGRRRAVWISKSDKLIEDAQRDWSALGMERLLVTPLSRFRQGTPIRPTEGILFTTYATLRTDERGEKLSRVRQIVEWLEALRRAGHVERIDDDHWKIPGDILERGQAYDRTRGGDGPRIKILSSEKLERQIATEGATWLDRELTAREPQVIVDRGFGHDVRNALQRRAERLVEMGYATVREGTVRIPPHTVVSLEQREVDRVGREMAAERGLTFTPSKAGEYVSGRLTGVASLASGRFAVIEDGLGCGPAPARSSC